MTKALILVTAHNPLARFDPLMRCLKEYAGLPGDKFVVLYVDYDHRDDVYDLEELLEANFYEGLKVEIQIAGPEFKDYYLCWAHKDLLRLSVVQEAYDYYIYSENDMLFTRKHFDYWFRYKDKLKKLNLEPSFCRFERQGDLKIPFDNYKRYNLTELTEDVWHDIPHKASVYLTPEDDNFIGFILLGNPYSGMMILDQDQAAEYIASPSAHINISHMLTGHRNWPVADRSSMGLAFENLKDGQDHRRVVPLVKKNGKIVIADVGLIQHLDTKYSDPLVKEPDFITTETMFV